jgi:urocanate hydratase
MSFDERTVMLANNPAEFKRRVDGTLQRHYSLVKNLSERGTYFFDYGNAFMKSVFDTGITEIAKNKQDTRNGFIWPSYVEDILGPELFDYGYGPFRWVCLSGKDEDLKKTDLAAAEVIKNLREKLRYQDEDNLRWVLDAEQNKLVVGTKARILYQDAKGRRAIALKLNDMVRKGEIGPVMLGRDHHDTGGTDSPFRETSNIKDGSNIMADMATNIFAGNAARGMTLCALHNGGGVGIGKSINGGFGMLLDGSERVDAILDTAMPWDVMGGVARRAWAQNPNSIETCIEFNQQNASRGEHITLPWPVDQKIL